MDANRLLHMILRQVMRRLVGRGIGAGVDRMTRGRADTGKDHPGQRPKGQPGVPRASRHTRQAMRLARRFGRF